MAHQTPIPPVLQRHNHPRLDSSEVHTHVSKVRQITSTVDSQDNELIELVIRIQRAECVECRSLLVVWVASQATPMSVLVLMIPVLLDGVEIGRSLSRTVGRQLDPAGMLAWAYGDAVAALYGLVLVEGDLDCAAALWEGLEFLERLSVVDAVFHYLAHPLAALHNAETCGSPRHASS